MQLKIEFQRAMIKLQNDKYFYENHFFSTAL